MRLRLFFPVLAWALASRAGAQAPSAGPLVLLVPASTRATALGNAWVAGRDQDVLFYNPAQLIGARNDFAITLARYGSASSFASASSVFSSGPASLTLGWGVQAMEFNPNAADTYPYVPSGLMTLGSGDGLSLLAGVGAAMVYKTFRIGVTGKYATDRVAYGADIPMRAPTRHDALLGDFGIARNVLSGVAGLALQNVALGHASGARHVDTPRQFALGWSGVKQAGEFDLAFAGQVTARDKWIAPGGGIEIGYGWIEGYSVALRAGARRPETNAERPVALGATINADRLTLEYALQFFDGGRTANRMTFRWR